MPNCRIGIVVTEYEYETFSKLVIDYLPYPTDLCDLCINRNKEGELPTCVKHCQPRAMQFGYLGDLVKQMEERPKMVLYAPRCEPMRPCLRNGTSNCCSCYSYGGAL